MTDEDGKVGDKKIKGVDSTGATKGVEAPDAVGGVTSIRPASGIGGVSGISGVGKNKQTRIMTLEERDELFRIIEEESKKLFGNAVLSPKKQDVISKAVKIAVDSGLMPAEAKASNKK